MKDFLIKNWQGILIVVMLLVIVNRCTWDSARDDIDDANDRRDKLLDVIEAKDLLIQSAEREKQQIRESLDVLNSELTKAEQVIVANQAENTALRKELAASRVSTENIRDNDDLIMEFRNHFPEYRESEDLGILDVTDRDGSVVAVITMPAWVVKGMILDRGETDNQKQQLANYQANEAEYGNIVQLNEQYKTLQANYILATEKQKTAFEDGRDACMAEHNDLHEKYVDKLNEPRFDIGNKWAWIGGGLLGAGACGFINGNIRF